MDGGGWVEVERVGGEDRWALGLVCNPIPMKGKILGEWRTLEEEGTLSQPHEVSQRLKQQGQGLHGLHQVFAYILWLGSLITVVVGVYLTLLPALGTLF